MSKLILPGKGPLLLDADLLPEALDTRLTAAETALASLNLRVAEIQVLASDTSTFTTSETTVLGPGSTLAAGTYLAIATMIFSSSVAGDRVKYHIKDPSYQTEGFFDLPSTANKAQAMTLAYSATYGSTCDFRVTAFRDAGTGNITCKANSRITVFEII